MPRSIVYAYDALWSVLPFGDPLPAYSAVHVLRFEGQWLAGISRGENAAARPQNRTARACNAIVDGRVRHYTKGKGSMLKTFTFEEDNGMKTVLQQFDSERRELLHSLRLRKGC